MTSTGECKNESDALIATKAKSVTHFVFAKRQFGEPQQTVRFVVGNDLLENFSQANSFLKNAVE